MSYTVAIRRAEITSGYRIGSVFQPFHRLLDEYVLGSSYNGTQGETVGCKLLENVNVEITQFGKTRNVETYCDLVHTPWLKSLAKCKTKDERVDVYSGDRLLQMKASPFYAVPFYRVSELTILVKTDSQLSFTISSHCSFSRRHFRVGGCHLFDVTTTSPPSYFIFYFDVSTPEIMLWPWWW